MSANKKPRRAYRPRPVDPQAAEFAVMAHRQMDPDRATQIVNHVRAAYQRMREGNGDGRDYDVLGAALNVAVVRAERIGSGQPIVDGITAAMAALRGADRGERYGFTGPGILSMNCGIDLYEQVLQASTPRQMADATDEVVRRQRAGIVQRTEGATT